MKHINTLITTALLVVCSVAMIGDKEWLGLTVGVAFWLLSLYVYYGIYNTPSKDSERYLAWKKILPETGQINRRLWTWIAISVLALLSIFLTRLVVMTKVAFFGMRYIDIVFGALYAVMMVLKGLWKKNNDLERNERMHEQGANEGASRCKTCKACRLRLPQRRILSQKDAGNRPYAR